MNTHNEAVEYKRLIPQQLLDEIRHNVTDESYLRSVLVTAWLDGRLFEMKAQRVRNEEFSRQFSKTVESISHETHYQTPEGRTQENTPGTQTYPDGSGPSQTV